MYYFSRVLRMIMISLMLQSCAYYAPAPPPATSPYYYGGYVSPSVSIFTPIFPIFSPYYYRPSGYYYGRGWWGGYRHRR